MKSGSQSGTYVFKIFIVSTGTARQLGTINGEYFFQKITHKWVENCMVYRLDAHARNVSQVINQ